MPQGSKYPNDISKSQLPWNIPLPLFQSYSFPRRSKYSIFDGWGSQNNTLDCFWMKRFLKFWVLAPSGFVVRGLLISVLTEIEHAKLLI